MSLPTGILELDRLLDMGDEKFDDGTVILIRGGPGAGKTTLAIQILDNQLANSSPEEPQFALFLSLENPSQRVLNYARV